MSKPNPNEVPVLQKFNSGREEYTISDGKKGRLLHRLDGPAVIEPSSSEWYYMGVRHRENGPAYISGSTIRYFFHGKVHREDGPAEITDEKNFKSERWYRNDNLHREDGPAYISKYEGTNSSSSGEYWYFCGKSHREDGPACISIFNGKRSEKYYLYGSQVRKDLFPLMSPGFKIKNQTDIGKIISKTHADDGTLLLKIEGKFAVNS